MKKYFSSYYLQVYYFPIILFCIFFIWRFLHITERDICLDEPFTIYHAQKSLYNIILLTIHGEPNPPLFMILVHLWIKFFGISPMSVRLIPLLFSSFTILFLYKSAYKLAGFYAALITSFLFLFSSLHFYYALEVRTYSLVSFFTAAIYYFYVLLIQGEKENRKWIVYSLIIANIGIILSHYFGWFVIANEGIILLFYFRNKVLRKKIITIITATVIVSIPLVIVIFRQFLVSSTPSWLSYPEFKQLRSQIYFFLNHRYAFFYIAYTLVFCFVVFIIHKIVFKKIAVSYFKETLILFLCFIVPYLTMYLVSYRMPIFFDRYILFNSIPLYLFIGVAVGKLLFPFWYLKIAVGLTIVMPFKEWMFINADYYYRREVKTRLNVP